MTSEINKQRKRLYGTSRLEEPERVQYLFTSTLGSYTEKTYLLENITLLLNAGLSIQESLEAIKPELASKGLRQKLTNMQNQIDGGSSLWRAFETARIFPKRIIALIKIGEQSGHLSESLALVALQDQKQRTFQSKLSAAMIYPVIILLTTLTVALIVSWVVLPRLANVFESLQVELPVYTRMLIATGEFMELYGVIVIPTLLLLALSTLFLLFFWRRTKYIGEYLVLNSPLTRRLIQEIELSRMGYMLGTMLESGIPIVQALDSMADATSFVLYERFYTQVRDAVEEGNSLVKSFKSFKRIHMLIPRPVQQMLFAAEKSGKLPDTLMKVGSTYEEKIDITSKQVATAAEPILLLFVGAGVFALAISVILPIYSLIGSIN